MTITKTEMVDKLNAEGLGTKAALKKLEVVELETMMAQLEDKEAVVITDEPTESPETPEDVTDETPETPGEDTVTDEDEPTEGDNEGDEDLATTEPEEVKVLLTTKHQLGIFTEYIYNVKNKGAKVKVENLGNGDAYVMSDDAPTVGNKNIRLFTGESRVFEGTTVVRAIAASQPEIQITEIE